MAARDMHGGAGMRTRERRDREAQRAMDEFETLAGLGGSAGDGAGGHAAGSDAGERSAYLVEHLATFTVTRETGIVYPADGMRRLLQLEKTNGIWSQKMQLCVEGQWVLVMDYETGSVMERFPAAWVHSPTAFTSPEPGELYNNVLAFVAGPPSGASVGGPGGGTAPPRRELHIFQCHDVDAQALVEELDALKGGGALDAASEPSREFIMERERERERERDAEQEPERPRRAQMTAQLGRGVDAERDDDVSSTGSDRLYEQDIAILNRCFDDIEKFIARLQHAAAASRELERRRRSRKGKKGGAGEGMLALRTRPPPERDFVDVLQKFKLSFNLLARLRAHIHDPNAPELVHFLFTPLALIVDASQEAGEGPAAGASGASGGGRLASRVVQPLLTREALNLLANCVTSKETELWHSLGDAWLVPREQWKTTVPPYQPVFMDGWSPDYQVDDQPIRRPSPRRAEAGREPEHAYGGSADEANLYGAGDQFPPYVRGARAADSGSATPSPEREAYREPRRQLDDAEAEAEAGAAWAREVAARGGRVVRVTYPRTANNDKELTVVRGEYLEVLDDSRKWWRARNRRGQTAHVPHTIVAPAQFPGPSPPASPHLYPNPVYAPYQDGARGSGGSSPTGSGRPGTDWVRRERLGKKDKAPPPPPPPPPPAPPILTQTDTVKSTKSTRSMRPAGAGDLDDDVQAELRAVLTLYQQRNASNKLDIKKTPDIFIHQTSKPEEVVQWLQAKGFSERAARELRVSGLELFGLSRTQLEQVLGADEGKRLYSQVLVQRNVSGYKTTSASELQNILRKVREKVEVS